MTNNISKPILLSLLTLSSSGLWGMESSPELKRSADEKTVAEQKTEANFFNELAQNRLDIKAGSKTGLMPIPAQLKGLISAHYPLSEEATKALNEYSVHICAAELEAKEQKAQAEAQAAEQHNLPRSKIDRFSLNADQTQIAFSLPIYEEQEWATSYTSLVCSIIDLENGKFCPTQVLPKAACAALSRDGTLLAVAKHRVSYPQQVKIWDLSSKNYTLTIDLPGGSILQKMQFSEDGTMLYIPITNWIDRAQKITIITYSLVHAQITSQVELSTKFMENHTLEALLPDGTCLVHSWKTEDSHENPAIQLKTEVYELALFNPTTEDIKQLVDFQDMHIHPQYISEKNHIILGSCYETLHIIEATTQKVLYAYGQFKKQSEMSDSDSDNDSDVESDDDNKKPVPPTAWSCDSTTNIEKNYIIRALSDGSITFERAKPLNFGSGNATFNPKLLPFVDWLYTTQKARDFKPLTLTQEAWGYFKQLDKFSQTALMRNLKLIAPCEPAPAAPRDLIQTSCTIM
jgi:hypothetical protein